MDSSESNSSSSSSDDETPDIAENDSNEDTPTGQITTNEIIAHDQKWIFGNQITINSFKDTCYKPQLHIPNLQEKKEIDFWMAFFPTEDIENIMRYTNDNLRERRKHITKGEFFKVIGMMYAMTLNIRRTRREYWSNEGSLFPAPAFGKRFGMGIHRFEEIINSMAFSQPIDENEDDWYQVRSFVEMTTSKWNDIFTPGYKITVDESMFAWYGKGLNRERGGMPAVIKIKRKPKGVGCECKTIADVQSGIMIGMEINEGKDAMQQKTWQREFGAGTATTLRLTRPWHGTGRIVIGDSWFASVKTATELQKRGLHFMGIVKTATRNYPIKELRERCPETRGQFAVATTTVNNNINLTGLSWRDKKVHTFVSTCGTTLEGQPAKKKRTDENGAYIIKEVPRPHLVEEYFEGAPAVDIHNHIRQSGLALEEVWNTQRWHHRIYASVLGIIETNAFLAFKYFKRDASSKHSDFTEALALQLINNPWVAETPVQEEHARIANPANLANPILIRPNPPLQPGDHTLIPLSRFEDRQRVQRRCIICVRVYKRVQKASYYCGSCGTRAVMCSPTTGRNCFTYHVQHGIPA